MASPKLPKGFIPFSLKSFPVAFCISSGLSLYMLLIFSISSFRPAIPLELFICLTVKGISSNRIARVIRTSDIPGFLILRLMYSRDLYKGWTTGFKRPQFSYFDKSLRASVIIFSVFPPALPLLQTRKTFD